MSPLPQPFAWLCSRAPQLTCRQSLMTFCEWSDEQLLTHFNTHYPQPRPWQLSHLRPEMHSALTSCLCKKRLDLAFCTDLLLVQKEAQSSIMAKQSTATNEHWGHWLEFCAAHSMDPYNTSTDFVPYLQVFGRRIRDGYLTTSRKPVRSGSVSDAL